MFQNPRSVPENASDLGEVLVMAATLAGFLVAMFNYYWPHNGINGTPGALLVVVSTALILGAALLVEFGPGAHPHLRTALNILSVLGILGTAFAAYLLEAPLLVILMLVALCGALMSLVFSETHGLRPAQEHRGAAR